MTQAGGREGWFLPGGETWNMPATLILGKTDSQTIIVGGGREGSSWVEGEKQLGGPLRGREKDRPQTLWHLPGSIIWLCLISYKKLCTRLVQAACLSSYPCTPSVPIFGSSHRLSLDGFVEWGSGGGGRRLGGGWEGGRRKRHGVINAILLAHFGALWGQEAGEPSSSLLSPYHEGCLLPPAGGGTLLISLSLLRDLAPSSAFYLVLFNL